MSRHETVPAAATPVAPPPTLPGAAAGTGPSASIAPSSEAPRTKAPASVPAATAASAAPKAPTSRRRRILVLVGGAALVAGAWYGWSWWTVGRFRVSTDDAYVKADVATISARAAGHVVEVAVGDNARVAAGDLLAAIDPGDARLAVGAAEGRIATQKASIDRIDAQMRAQRATIAQAEAQLVSAQSDVARSEADLVRATDLVRSAAGTQQRLDQARSDRDRVRAAVAVADAGVAAARGSLGVLEAQRREAEQTLGELQTALDKARRDLDFTRVVAPFAGVVGNRAVQLGQYVQPGTRLLALVPLDTVQIEANFKETQVGRLKPGQPVEVVIDAFKSRPVEGRVASIAPASGAQFSLLPPENATGNFTKIVQRIPVRISLPAELVAEGVVRPGMSVEVSVDTREGAR